MILYKVVTKCSRHSSSAQGNYCLTYEPQSTVEAVPGSLGIFCFTKKREAIAWLYTIYSSAWPKYFTIIKVHALDRCDRKLPLVSSYVAAELLRMFDCGESVLKETVPQGTVITMRVEVLT